uniref:Uncharacterized protein n=1 Tax=Caenorhabditis japonica TaxID=281687 RepID=A0A8R1EQ00_CAEJA
MIAPKKEPGIAIHIPIEPSGCNSSGTIQFSQGLLPHSSWLVVPVTSTLNDKIPAPQIQVMNSTDYLKIIEIASNDLAVMTKLKLEQAKKAAVEAKNHREFMVRFKDQTPYNRTLAMLQNTSPSAGALSPL